MAAEALRNLGTLAEGLQERVYQLEAIATLIGETIRTWSGQLLRPSR